MQARILTTAMFDMRGGLGDGRISAYRRQIKYKLQGAMELGVLADDRSRNHIH